MATVLIVDDEPNYCWMLSELLQQVGHETVTAAKSVEALEIIRLGDVDVLVTDLRMAETDGMQLLAQARTVAPWLSVIIMTAYGTVDRAVEAMRLGAYDFILKPFDNRAMIQAIGKAAERTTLVRANMRLTQTLEAQYRFDHLVGSSPSMHAVFDRIRRVCETKTTVLITGESGSGKELVARAIHFNSPRCGHPFLAVNCSALPETLAESELFGHQRGAFTGAIGTHVGLFEQARGGTLFLDEIGELSLALQAKLLRVLDTQEIRRVGSSSAISVDARIVAATNRDLKAEVKAGRFREDLFFRLNVVKIDVPPLRERPEDIPLLAETYLQQLVKEGASRGKRLAPETIAYLVRYPWPGNVRELHNAVAHASLMARSEDITPEDFPLEVVAGTDWVAGLDRVIPNATPLDAVLRAVERHLIQRALERANGVQAKAAERLGISRSLLQYKLKHIGKDDSERP
jgi:two-component system NtrC family response regulator